jgi:transient receptor potential cation channel subfamily M protein 3
MELFMAEWCLEAPKLVITIHGGKQNFDIPPKLKKLFKRGLYKAAKTTGAWVFTAGTNSGKYMNLFIDCHEGMNESISFL